MINEVEMEIVQLYIAKSKRKRVMWELGNPKRRKEIMVQRLLFLNTWKPECLHPIEYMPKEELEKYLYKLSGNRRAYFIGDNNDIGYLSLQDAVSKADDGAWCVIYCGNGYGYFQGEAEIAKQPRYLLYN